MSYDRIYLNNIDMKGYENLSDTLSVKDILNNNEYKLVQAIHFNFIIELDWLMSNANKTSRTVDTILVVDKNYKIIDSTLKKYPNVSVFYPNMPYSYGVHHSKMSIMSYEEGIIVYIYTANMVPLDWNYATQGIWKSPLLKINKNTVESGNLAWELAKYLKTYTFNPNPLDTIIDKISHCFLSDEKVKLISSVPGIFHHEKWGLELVKSLLKEKKFDQKLLVAQVSSIGSLNVAGGNWIQSYFLKCFNTDCWDNFRLIYPSETNIRFSICGYQSGIMFPYRHRVHQFQQYVQNLLYDWKSDRLNRTMFSPHAKTYVSFSDGNDPASINWFILTSANLSKAAWGNIRTNSFKYQIRSYEIGVLIYPDLNKEPFDTLLYDIPLKKYSQDDQPWFSDTKHNSVNFTNIAKDCNQWRLFGQNVTRAQHSTIETKHI
ncbi:hypothetical protein A3Q56_00943 [Intoshia linei]|uniref:Tyrosyl-DNA phosphodiesterase 1 n=1 Tax=Intoshia linei TaxID=1819745 RepID=A0A177BAQ7_9BILA|nr:hypothetical protein A3Q56_00943 [Intoshia linei]